MMPATAPKRHAACARGEFDGHFRTHTTSRFEGAARLAVAQDWTTFDPSGLVGEFETWVNRTLVEFARESLKPTVFADLGFPGMLVGIAALGLVIAGAIRLLMSFRLPQVVREGIIMAFAFSMSRDGVEVSLPKTLGALVMFLIVFLLLNKFVFPKAMLWLNRHQTSLKARPA